MINTDLHILEVFCLSVKHASHCKDFSFARKTGVSPPPPRSVSFVVSVYLLALHPGFEDVPLKY